VKNESYLFNLSPFKFTSDVMADCDFFSLSSFFFSQDDVTLQLFKSGNLMMYGKQDAFYWVGEKSLVI